MSNMEIASVVASITSVIVACLAIWLSITFFRMTTKISEDTKEASRRIESSVDKLEKIFDKLYAGMFSMMSDTVSDMRKHIWSDEEPDTNLSKVAEQKANEKIEKFREEMQSELSRIVGRTDAKIGEVQDKIQELLDKAIMESRHVEKAAFTEIVAGEVLKSLQRLDKFVSRITAEIVVDELPGFDLEDIKEGIIQLRDEGFIELPKYVKNGKDIVPETTVKLR